MLFGIDNNLLSRALDEELFEPYEAKGLDEVDSAFILDPTHHVTPIDHGDVCLNIDRKWFASRGIAPPTSLDDLTAPRYRKLLVVQNPATSTPGLAFMLASIARFGEDGWQDYWRRLRANDVLVVDGWEEAYTQRFSGAGGSKGTRPIVVSYATSPAAEVHLRHEASHDGPDGGRRSELLPAGRVRRRPRRREERRRCPRPDRLHALGALPGSAAREHVRAPGTHGNAAARRVPTLRRLPVRTTRALGGEIGENRDRWIDEWTQTVLR